MNIVSGAWLLVAAMALTACSHMPSSTPQVSEPAGASRVPALGGGVFLLKVTNDPGPREMESLIKPDKRIKSVQPNLIYRADGAGNGVKN